MKKIGITTIVRVNNYGAELQAYATQKVLQDLGYDAEIIDYLFYKHPRHIATKQSRPLFPMGIKKMMAEFLYPHITRIKQVFQNNDAQKRREARFDAFHKNNTRFSEEYRSIEDLFRAKMSYDVYMVGSDQVWNPGIYSSLDPYFLKFVPAGKRKISYASSFGVSELPAVAYDYYRKSLQELDAISVRESHAVDQVKNLSGKDAYWVVDPTLLIRAEDWRSVAIAPALVPERYVLLYELTPCPYLKALAEHIATLKKCSVVRITKDSNSVESKGNIINMTDAGPSEFLYLFSRAEFVVTNSFHGTAFSANFSRPFFVVAPARKHNNSRQQSLLNLLGLSDRLLKEGALLPAEAQTHMDFSVANERLEEARKRSLEYLITAIG